MNQRPLVYLASPYTAGGANAATREARFKTSCIAAAKLIKNGYYVFSPIAHSHMIEVLGGYKSHSGWLEQDYAVLEHCSAMFILKLWGWEKSRGILEELFFCKSRGIPVRMIEFYKGNLCLKNWAL
jgi:hypothetical protein